MEPCRSGLHACRVAARIAEMRGGRAAYLEAAARQARSLAERLEV